MIDWGDEENDSSPSCACLLLLAASSLCSESPRLTSCKMGTKIKWDSTSKKEMQQTLSWKMHATSVTPYHCYQALDLFCHPPPTSGLTYGLSAVMPAVWSPTCAHGHSVYGSYKITQHKVPAFTLACCLHSPNLTTSKIKLILITCHLLPVVCVLAPRVPVDSLLSELKPGDTAHSSLPQVQLTLPASFGISSTAFCSSLPLQRYLQQPS